MQEGDYLIVDPACDLELTERVEVDDRTLPYAEQDCPQNKLNLAGEYSLTFPSPWKHARAKREKQEELQSVSRGFCHRQDGFERHDGLPSGTRRSTGATRDQPSQRHRAGLDRRLL